MKKPQSSLHEVQEFHRGKWIPVLTENEDGKEVKKTVKISEETAAIMNIDPIADMKSKAKKTKHFMYVKVKNEDSAEKIAKDAEKATKKAEKAAEKAAKEAAKAKANELPSYMEQKNILKAAGVEFKSNAKKADLLVVYKQYLADEAAKK